MHCNDQSCHNGDVFICMPIVLLASVVVKRFGKLCSLRWMTFCLSFELVFGSHYGGCFFHFDPSLRRIVELGAAVTDASLFSLRCDFYRWAARRSWGNCELWADVADGLGCSSHHVGALPMMTYVLWPAIVWCQRCLGLARARFNKFFNPSESLLFSKCKVILPYFILRRG